MSTNQPANPVLLKKAVTTIAIWPLAGSLTYTARLAYNALVQLAQGITPDEKGGFSVALSQVLKAYNSDTRYSTRVRGYIESMVGQRVRWAPLAQADVEAEQASDGLAGDIEEKRVFSLLAEARFFKRSGEYWIRYFFPPTINQIILDPRRWALFNLLEQSQCSSYAAITLFEICSRYRDVPGGRTNRESTEWWTNTLRGNADSKAREWRKVKNEVVRPAILEIRQRTSLDVELLEYKQGRAVTSVQFAVTRRSQQPLALAENLDLIERGEKLLIQETDVDSLIDTFGRERVLAGMTALENRLLAHPLKPILQRRAYLEKIIKNDHGDGSHSQTSAPMQPKPPVVESQKVEELSTQCEDRLHRLMGQRLAQLPEEEIVRYAEIAKAKLNPNNLVHQSLLRRYVNKQYRSPLIWRNIVEAYAVDQFGPDWIGSVSVDMD